MLQDNMHSIVDFVGPSPAFFKDVLLFKDVSNIPFAALVFPVHQVSVY